MRVYLERLVDIQRSLNETQKRWIRESTWNHFLHLQVHTMSRPFMCWLSRRWNHETCQLKIRDDYFVTITEEMIGRMLGLPCGEYPYVFENPTQRDKDEVKKLKKEYNGEGGLSYGAIHNCCLLEIKDRIRFMRHFILFVLGTTLCTTKSNFTSPKLLNVVLDKHIDETHPWNWSRFILDWMKKFSGTDQVDGVQGSPLVLLFVYLDRLNIGGKGLRWIIDAPRLLAWQQTDVDKAIEADKVGEGEYGELNTVRNVVYGKKYPIGPEMETPPEFFEGYRVTKPAVNVRKEKPQHPGMLLKAKPRKAKRIADIKSDPLVDRLIELILHPDSISQR